MSMSVGTDLLSTLPEGLPGTQRAAHGREPALFMAVAGWQLAQATWVMRSMSFLGCPSARPTCRSSSAAMLFLYVVERLTIGAPPKDGSDAHIPIE